jgi:hypothetical protein
MIPRVLNLRSTEDDEGAREKMIQLWETSLTLLIPMGLTWNCGIPRFGVAIA